MAETLLETHPRWLGHPRYHAGFFAMFLMTFSAVQFLGLVPTFARAVDEGGFLGWTVLVAVLVGSAIVGYLLYYLLSAGYGGPPVEKGTRRKRARADEAERAFAREAVVPVVLWIVPCAAAVWARATGVMDHVVAVAAAGLPLALALGIVGWLRTRHIKYVLTDESLLVHYQRRLVVEDLPLDKVRNVLVVERGLGRIGKGGDLVITLPSGSPIKAKEEVRDPVWREVGHAARNRFHLVGVRRAARLRRLVLAAAEIHDLPEAERKSRLLALRIERDVPFSPGARSPDE